MITPLDIKSAVNDLLKARFPTIPLKSQDVSEGFSRPSLTVELDDIKIETLESQIETSLLVRTYYFPDNNNEDESIELLKKQFEIPLAFGNKLAVEDRFLNIIEPNCFITDRILINEFSILFYQATEDTEAPFITTLNYNGSEV